MSDRPHDDSHDLPHEGPIKTPKQLIWAVVWAFVIPIFVIVLLVMYVTSSPQPAAGSTGLDAQSVAQRIQRVGSVVVKDVTDVAAMKTGEQVYTAQCLACHGAGVAGAPKLGDEAAWAARIKTGYDALLTSALKGKGAMGAQGGGDSSDLEIGRAVVFMANKSGAKFDEPKAAATAAPATAAAPTAAAPAAAAAPVAAAPVAAAGGEPPALYAQNCAVCHAAGIAGAPKTGDKAGWSARLAQGVDGLTANAIKGKGAMPARGGAAQASDADIKAVVAYMVNSVK